MIRKLVPIILAFVAVLLLGAGLAWGIATGVGIPYQDPTPAQREYERFHMRICDGLLAGAFYLLAAAVLSAIILWWKAILKRFSKRTSTGT